MIYLDRLDIYSFFALLRSKDITSVVLLEPLTVLQKFWRLILYVKRINLVESDFFAGELKFPDGESVMLKGQTLAGEMAFEAAHLVLKSSPEVEKYNKIYARNTIKLYIAKQLYYELSYWTTRLMVAQVCSLHTQTEVWIKKPCLFDKKIIIDKFFDVKINFYSTLFSPYVALIKSLLLDIARDIRLRIRNIFSGGDKNIQSKIKHESVLLLQEDDIHSNLSLRGQPHWLDFTKNDNFKTWILKTLPPKVGFVKDHRVLHEHGITLVSLPRLLSALHAMKRNPAILEIRKNRLRTYLSLFKTSSYAGNFFLLRIAYLQRQAELIGALALKLKAKVFLVRETFVEYSDAMMLIAPKINVLTIAYQYSNINVLTPVMMATADKYLIFSDLYKDLFRVGDIEPEEFLITGYLYDGVIPYVEKKSNKHRAILKAAGATFIVCYFDEAVQHDRWGLVSKEAHLCELHALARKVLDDKSFGLVIKSQFVFNSPSQMYPDDDLIQKAKKTGRYLELKEGSHRNIIYPTEAALVADLCISHKFGATAGLESAIAGIRTILLDPYKTKTLFDDIYSKADIVYDSIDILIKAISSYRNGYAARSALGDWSNIINNFDSCRDKKSVERLNSEIVRSVSVHK